MLTVNIARNNSWKFNIKCFGKGRKRFISIFEKSEKVSQETFFSVCLYQKLFINLTIKQKQIKFFFNYSKYIKILNNGLMQASFLSVDLIVNILLRNFCFETKNSFI